MTDFTLNNKEFQQLNKVLGCLDCYSADTEQQRTQKVLKVLESFLQQNVRRKFNCENHIRDKINRLQTDYLEGVPVNTLGQTFAAALRNVVLGIQQFSTGISVNIKEDSIATIYQIEYMNKRLSQSHSVKLPTLQVLNDKTAIIKISRHAAWRTLAASLLLIPFRRSSSHYALDMTELWTGDLEIHYQKLRAIIVYVSLMAITSAEDHSIVGSEIQIKHDSSETEDYIEIIRRQNIADVLSMEDLALCSKRLIRPSFLTNTNFDSCDIDSNSSWIVDFANKNVGGGTFRRGGAQEEIMFVCYPELCLAMLFNTTLSDNEAVLFRGIHKWFSHEGYLQSFKIVALDRSTRTKQFVALDALPFRSQTEKQSFQYNPIVIMREINKMAAAAGYMAVNDILSTGNWGCGCFGGDVRLKFLIQWIVCTYFGLKMVYTPFEHAVNEHLTKLVSKFESFTVEQLFRSEILYHSRK